MATTTTTPSSSLTAPLLRPSSNPNPAPRSLPLLRSRRCARAVATSAGGHGAAQRSGIWSIRDDLVVPRSPYFPVEYASGQERGPSPMVMERFQSVVSQLFQHRIIRCGGPVEDDMANIIVAQLLYLDAIDPNKDIIMYVNSPGGSVTAVWELFCLVLGQKRYSLPNSRIMIHQPLGGAQGQETDLEIQANEMLHHKANLNGYLAYHTGQPLDKINVDTDRDFFMSAKEAKEYGLIDGVIMNPLKALQPLPASS
uniref:ATP-dependent Clp protease proteolytic subunit n=1 Tax=Oryza punctata TaxID=4537 RepID=A0A0E0KCT5_ORYPU